MFGKKGLAQPAKAPRAAQSPMILGSGFPFPTKRDKLPPFWFSVLESNDRKCLLIESVRFTEVRAVYLPNSKLCGSRRSNRNPLANGSGTHPGTNQRTRLHFTCHNAEIGPTLPEVKLGPCLAGGLGIPLETFSLTCRARLCRGLHWFALFMVACVASCGGIRIECDIAFTALSAVCLYPRCRGLVCLLHKCCSFVSSCRVNANRNGSSCNAGSGC
jgi:hypothetical protein